MHIGLYETNYLCGYKGERPLKPRLAYKDLPCLYPPGSAHPCKDRVRGELRHIPMLKPKARPPQVPDLTWVARPVTVPPPKNVTFGKATKVFDTKFGPMDMLTVNKLHQQMFYSTRATRAMEECAIPMVKPSEHRMIRDFKPDMVSFKSERYEPAPEDWQHAPMWDRIQMRYGTEKSSIADDRNPLIYNKRQKQGVHAGRVGDVPKVYGPFTRLDPKCDSKRRVKICSGIATSTSKVDTLFAQQSEDSSIRPLPGYAGYQPMIPPEDVQCDKTWAKNVIPEMKKAFKTMPDRLHSNKQFAREESFSNIVTLTSPFNPNNLIGYDVKPVTMETRFESCLENLQHTAEVAN